MQMRQIKFRGRRIDYQVWPDSPNIQWVHGLYFTAPLTDENSGMNADAGWYFLSGGERKHCIVQDGTSFVVDPDTVGEWTGLRDSKRTVEFPEGQDVYEDDIVRVTDDIGDSSIHRVEYQGAQNYPAFDLVPDPGYDSNALSWALAMYRVEVIGNVHDTPNLLEAHNG